MVTVLGVAPSVLAVSSFVIAAVDSVDNGSDIPENLIPRLVTAVDDRRADGAFGGDTTWTAAVDAPLSTSSTALSTGVRTEGETEGNTGGNTGGNVVKRRASRAGMVIVSRASAP
jgi:hypothetical protein